MHSWVGKRSPAHCSSIGKALLAELSPEEFGVRYPDPGLEARTPATITRRDALREHLNLVRAQGYAEDLEELEEHLCCVAAPVTGRTGSVVASISISGPASRLRDPAVLTVAADAVRATARQISARLGAPETALCADAS
jgi:DNA-binding IclR family transcriptional regulator